MKTSSPWKKWASEHGRFTINPMPAFGNCAPAPMFTPTALSCRSEEHTSELQSLMRISYAVFCLTKKNHVNTSRTTMQHATSTRLLRQKLIRHTVHRTQP